MNIIKKQSLSSLITIGVAIFSLVAVIIYGVNGNMDGQFNGLNESSVIVLSVLSIIFSAAIVVLSNLSFEGNTKKIVDFAITLLKIVMVVMLILSFMLFLYFSVCAKVSIFENLHIQLKRLQYNIYRAAFQLDF